MFPAKDYMTKEVLSVKSNTPIWDAIEILAKNKVSGLPVIDDEKNLVGVISEWDVLDLLTERTFRKEETVKDYMTAHVISFDENDSVMDICDFLKSENKRRAPIVKEKKLVGIISRHDIIKLILDIRNKL